jgi:hypothetical protein
MGIGVKKLVNGALGVIGLRLLTASRYEAMQFQVALRPRMNGQRIEPQYMSRFLQIFGVPAPDTPDWIYFPFDRDSEQARRLLATVSEVEFDHWRSYLAAMDRERIPGEIVEFGVAGGAGLKQIAEFADALGLRKQIYGFDSFEGLPAPGTLDPPGWKRGQFAAKLDAVKAYLRPDLHSNLHLVEGWFSKTLQQPEIAAALSSIGFARIDCDLYESAVECLRFLRGRLASGAYLIFDDWTDLVEFGETRAFFEFVEQTRAEYRFEFLTRIGLGGFHVRVWHR